MNGVSTEAICLKLFTFSLRDRAKSWQRSIPAGQITTWNQLVKAFLSKYFPPGRTARLRAEITQFKQLDQESLYDAWERYRELLRKCPHHGLQKWLVIEMFYNALLPNYKGIVDSAAGGSLMGKSHDEAYTLICEMADNYQWHFDRSGQSRRPIGSSSQESSEITSLKAQISGLTDQLKGMSERAVGTTNCQICGDFHPMEECRLVTSSDTNDVEQVNYMQNRLNRQPNNPFSNTYNPGWKNHPNFSWSGQQNQTEQPRGDMGRSQQTQPQQQFSSSRNFRPPGFQHQVNQNMRNDGEGSSNEKKSGLEEMMMKCLSKMDLVIGEQGATIKAVVQSNEQNTAAIRNLERQFGQLANSQASRNQGVLPSQTEPNPREHCKAVTLRSGKPLIKDPTRDDMGPEEEEASIIQEPELVEVEIENVVGASKKIQETSSTSKPIMKAYTPPIPFPNRLKEFKD